jgi:hypothetical protein
MPSLKPPLASGISDRSGTGGTGQVTQCPGRLLGGASHASTKPGAKVGGRHACLPMGAPRRGRGLTGRLLPPRDGLCGRRGEWPAPSARGPCRRDHGDAGELWRWHASHRAPLAVACAPSAGLAGASEWSEDTASTSSMLHLEHTRQWQDLRLSKGG